MERVVFHCDCNSFFASCELLTHPELRDVPVAVCGDPASRHGIILAKNEPAKRYHVQTAETVYSALRKCPSLHLLAPHHERYRELSRLVNAIYARYTDCIEPFGIDESWLEMTHTWHLFGDAPEAVAHEIRRAVKNELGLTISVGVSFNKVFAKLGSDYKKPDAVTVFSRRNYRELVWPLPAGDLLFVGKSAQAQLAQMGVRTIGALACASEAELRDRLGKLGPEIRRYARGEDDAPVRRAGEAEEVKSVGNGLTFRRDLTSLSDARTGIGPLAEEVAMRLRRGGLFCCSVQLLIKDAKLQSISRQKQLSYPTHLARDIADAALSLLRENWTFPHPIRMLTVTALHLTDGSDFVQQLSLLEKPPPAPDAKREKLEQSMDRIREKYGKTAVGSASTVRSDLGLEPPLIRPQALKKKE